MHTCQSKKFPFTDCPNTGETLQNGVCKCPDGQSVQDGACKTTAGKSYEFDYSNDFNKRKKWLIIS